MALNYGDSYIDGSLAYGEFTFTQSENSAPVFSSVSALDVTQGQAYELTLTATDADGDAVTFSLSNNSLSWVSIDGAIVTISPPVDVAVGLYNVTATATDGVNSVDQVINISVLQAGAVLIAPIKRRIIWDEQQTPDLIIGDDFIHCVQLVAGVNQLPFNVSAAESIKACVTNLSHRLKLTDDVLLSDSSIGADWVNGLVAMDLGAGITEGVSGYITGEQLGYVEIEVKLLGNRFTWFAPVNIITGQID